MQTSEAIAAAPLGIQEYVLGHYGYEITGNKHIACPFCNQKKFRISNFKKGDGSYCGICVCGTYPLIKLAAHRSGKTGKEFLDEIDALIGNRPDEIKPKAANRYAQDHLALFDSSVELRGTTGQNYLMARGITILPRHNVRLATGVDYIDADGKSLGRFDAILTLLTDELGRPHKIHYTYLNGDGSAKADIEKPRRLFSLTEITPSLAARIWNPSEVEAVGEGLESCMSFSMLRKVPCNPCLNTVNLKAYRFSDYVKTGFIAMDNDANGAGLAAAAECAHRNILQRENLQEVRILFPKTIGYDFNDALMFGDEICEILVCKKSNGQA